MALSQDPGLQIGTKAFALIAVGFGVNAIFRPEHALSFFEWEMPTTLAERQLVESLLYAYGVRDIFWGFATWIAAAYGTPRSAGWTLVGGSAVAFADGIICYSWGHGHWGHWSYAPLFTLLGATLLGVFDKA